MIGVTGTSASMFTAIDIGGTCTYMTWLDNMAGRFARAKSLPPRSEVIVRTGGGG